MAGRSRGDEGAGGGVEGAAAGAGLPPRQRQRHAGGGKQAVRLHGAGVLQGAVPQAPAADVPQIRAGADPRRIPAAAGRSPGAGRHTAAAPVGNSLRHGYPGKRAAIHHRGGGAKRRGGNRPEGQNQNHSAAHKAVPQAAEIRKKMWHRPRADIPDEKGNRAVPEVHLGGDEEAVRGGEGSAEQGVSPQPAGAVRPDAPRRLPGRGASGGCAGTQQHRDDPHLPAVHGKRKCPPAGQVWPAQREGIIIISCNLLKTVK